MTKHSQAHEEHAQAAHAALQVGALSCCWPAQPFSTKSHPCAGPNGVSMHVCLQVVQREARELSQQQHAMHDYQQKMLQQLGYAALPCAASALTQAAPLPSCTLDVRGKQGC